MNTAKTFSILNHLDKLEPAEQGRYICPVCGKHNLTIKKQSGAYQCWNGCECKDIRDAIAPWQENEKTTSSWHKPSRTKKPIEPAQIPEKINLAKLPQKATDSPQPQKRIDNKHGEVQEWTYYYTADKWKIRTQWVDATKSKGYDKTFLLWHRDVSGKSIANAGEGIRPPYRIDEALAAAKASGANAVMGAEGEVAVERYRQIGIACITLGGFSQDELALMSQLLKDAELGLVYHPDHDKTGRDKASTIQKACDRAGVFCMVLDPVAIYFDIPDKGDVEEILAAMDVQEFIRRLEEEIHFSVESKRTSKLADDSKAVNIPDSLDPDTEFTQKALNFLYGDKPWICANDKLYCRVGNYYKHSPDAVERPKIASFCNSYAVQQKDGSIRYPYAKPSKVREVLQWVKDRLEVDPNLLNPPGLNCTNGVLKLQWNGSIPNLELVQHDPKFYYTYEPIVTYDPDADSSDCDRLLEVLDAPQREIFLRTVAASLDLATVRQHKGRLVRGLLLKGEGSNGKDSLREVVAAMYGYQGMTGCTLADFKAYDDGRKFPLSRLRTCRVNWATENANTSKVDKIQSIKAFITGDSLSCEGKGKDEEDFAPTGVGLFNVNDTPNLQASLEAIVSRWGILTFTKTFKIGADPLKGEIEADPRFKYDPNFLKQQVLPAFLNRVLAALADLMRDGIDFSCTQKAMLEIQAENSHLFQFCQETGLGYDPNGTVSVGELWERLKAWYIDNGTLAIEVSDKGKEKNIWIDQVRRGDANVKGANQVLARFLELFPKAKRCHLGSNKMGIQGLAFNISQFEPKVSQSLASALASNPDTARDVSQLSQFCNSDEKNETKILEIQKDECTELKSLNEEEKLTQLANNPDVASNTASAVANQLANASEKLANVAPAIAEVTASNISSADKLAIQLLKCQTWAAVVKLIDAVASAVGEQQQAVFRFALPYITADEREHLTHLLAAHIQQFPHDYAAYSWVSEGFREKALELVRSNKAKVKLASE